MGVNSKATWKRKGKCFQNENIFVTFEFAFVRNIVAKKRLREFWARHPDSEETLKTWYKVMMGGQWINSNHVKKQYGNASIVGKNGIVFNICGNKYRLIVKFNYEMQWGWIRFIGTHSEYDKTDALTI